MGHWGITLNSEALRKNCTYLVFFWDSIFPHSYLLPYCRNIVRMRKIQTGKTPNMYTFHVVIVSDSNLYGCSVGLSDLFSLQVHGDLWGRHEIKIIVINNGSGRLFLYSCPNSATGLRKTLFRTRFNFF